MMERLRPVSVVLVAFLICTLSAWGTQPLATLEASGDQGLRWSLLQTEAVPAEGITFTLDGGVLAPELALPQLRVREAEGRDFELEMADGPEGTFEPVLLHGGSASLPLGLPDVSALQRARFRLQGNNAVDLIFEPVNPLLLTPTRRGGQTVLSVANWGAPAVIEVMAQDSLGRDVDLELEGAGTLGGGDWRFVAVLDPGTQTNLRLAPDKGPVGFPVTLQVRSDLGSSAQTTLYAPEAGTGLCATPGKDGAGWTLSGVVNTYYPITASVTAGATSITVGTSAGSTAPIASGDLLLLIQMQDAEANYTNSDSYGDGVAGGNASGYTAVNNSGKYEFVKATSLMGTNLQVQGAGTGGGTLNAYGVGPSTATRGRRSAQVVRVPQYTTATLSSTLTCLAWNGSVGGILSLDVSGALTLGGTVSVNGMGFRAGTNRSLGGGAATATDYRIAATINAFGLKAEGVAGTPAVMPNSNPGTGLQGYPDGDAGRGAPGNAGGGANDSTPADNAMNAGGGGGANGGGGGKGGNTWSANQAYGGFGGATVTNAADRLVLGGGGGAGDSNNTGPANGGAGGGIVLIRTNTVTGTGTITANGAAAPTSISDGAGGGGAGGTILVYAKTAGALTGLTVNANGGRGGDAWPAQDGTTYPGNRHGPGGGGGGGAILLSGAPTASTATAGANGITTTANDAYGSTPGGAGNVATTVIGTQIPGTDSGAECTGSPTYIVKTSSAGTGYVSPGQTITYTVTATNTTDSTWTNVALTDPLPTGTTWVSTQLTYPTSTVGTYLDQFSLTPIANPQSWQGSNDGTITWPTTTPWVEIGDDGDPTGGDVRVVVDGTTNAMRLNRNGNGASRPASLAGGVAATLTFNYRRSGTEATDSVTVAAYSGTAWTDLITIPGGTNEAAYLASGNIPIPASCINANFQLRFLTGGTNSDHDYFYFDNIQISLTTRPYASGEGGAPPNLASGYTLHPYESLTAVVTVTVDGNLSPGISQIPNIATVTAAGGISQQATATNPVFSAPVVSSPIFAGDTSISGTSSAPVGSTITVYKNGVSMGTTTVQSGGVWVLSGVSGLLGGESITAVGSASGATSAVSNTVVVTPAAPVVTGPIIAGATSVSGTSTAPVGSTISVTVGGTPYTTTVQAGGTYSVTVPALVAGEEVNATVTAGGQTSGVSNTVTVQNPAPVVNGPILADPASISGTSAAPVGTTITVYSNGSPLGTTTVLGDGTWTYSGAGLSGLIGGETVTATAGTGASQSVVSNTVVVAPVPPSVTAPIIAGATTVSGTSSAPEGSTITVYKNGVSIGTTTVLAGGTWTLSGIDPPLEALDKITATVTVGGAVSGLSNEVIVDPAPILDPSIPPIVTASLVTTGSPQTIYGSSVEPPGSVITVYLNGLPLATQPVVQADGTWSLPGVTLAAGDLVKATVLANRINVTDSGFSNVVRVSANSGSVTPPPEITGTYLDGATSVSGTSVPGATVDVYADGLYLGTVTADGSGNWILGPGPGIGPLPSGTILSATATETGKGTSDWSAPVIVGSMLMLLRSDAMTSLTQDRAPIFTHPQKTLHYPSLETIGPNHVFNQTEGPSPQPASPGTLDDDKAYVRNIHSLDLEPEPAVLSDNGRPLVFYELLDNDTKTLYLTKSGTDIVFTITP